MYLLSSSYVFVTSVIQICHDIPADLLKIFVRICHSDLSPYSYGFEKIQMNKMKICHKSLWVCENVHMNTSKFKDDFRCLPSSFVEGSLKG